MVFLPTASSAPEPMKLTDTYLAELPPPEPPLELPPPELILVFCAVMTKIGSAHVCTPVTAH